MNSSPARSYETPAVVYEANLLAHAGSSVTSTPGCRLWWFLRRLA